MQIQNSTAINNYSFTARCPQIKDAEWVSHIVNSTFPHFSATKHKPIFISYVEKDQTYIRKLKSLQDTIDRIELNPHIKRYNSYKNPFEKILDFFYYHTLSAQKKKMFNIQQTIYNKITQIFDLRCACFENTLKGLVPKPLEMINYMKNEKIGNCMEDAVLTNIVLKLNGIKNATRIHLSNIINKNEEIIDHAVCIINPPNVPLKEGKLHPKAIIIDAWCGKSDFASNMLTYYRNLKDKHFHVNKLKDVVYKPVPDDGLTPEILEKIKSEYPQLIYPNKNRKFLDIK